MKFKDKRSVLFLFVAMLASSIIIGSYCQTRFAPVEDSVESSKQDQKKLSPDGKAKEKLERIK